MTLTLRRVVQNHVSRILERRPTGGEEGADGKLWSFADDQPYVLYATQRTIFALQKYEEYHIAVDSLDAVGSLNDDDDDDDDSHPKDLPELLAQKLADALFRPVINQVLSQFSAIEISTALSLGSNNSDILLPGETWAANIIRDWLVRLSEDFRHSQVAADLTQRVSDLIRIKKFTEHYQPSANLAKRLKDNAILQLEDLKGEYNNICNCDEVGKELSQLTTWEDEKLQTILFQYLFRQYLVRSSNSFEDLLDKESSQTELWRLIQKARSTLDSILKTDPMASTL